MSRRGKNTHNSTKNNTTPVKSRDPTTVRLEQPNIDETEENDLKNNFRRMFETLKEEMKNFLKWRKRLTKNWKTSTNPLKKAKKKQSNI